MQQARKKRFSRLLCCLIAVQMLVPVMLGTVFGGAGISAASAAAPLKITRGSNSCFTLANPSSLTFALSFALDANNNPTVTAVSTDNGVRKELVRWVSALQPNDYSYAHGNTTWIDVFVVNASCLSKLPLGKWALEISYPNGQGTSIPFYILQENTIIFSQQPESVTIDEGDKATFTLSVVGSSGYSYQWQRLSRTGWKNLSGKTKRTLTLTNTNGINGWQYRCLVHSNAGDAYSDTVTVRINLNYTPPATGDHSMPLLYALCAAGSLCTMVGCVLIGCRKRSQATKC